MKVKSLFAECFSLKARSKLWAFATLETLLMEGLWLPLSSLKEMIAFYWHCIIVLLKQKKKTLSFWGFKKFANWRTLIATQYFQGLKEVILFL